jgi:hypothetical protein
LTTTTTRRLRLDRNQLARALNGDPEVVRQFELLLSLVNAFESGGGTGGAVDSVNGLTGVVVLDAGDVGADSAGTAATATAALAATLADIATSGSADDLVAGTVPVARLPLTTVTPGSYTSTNLTVDATGRITAASNGSGGGGTFGAATATFTVGLDSVTITVVDAGVSAGSDIVLSIGTASGREPDEFVFAPVHAIVASVTAGVGFDILVTCPDADADGAYLINYTRD